MTKLKLCNGNETILDIFPWDIFKSNSISFFFIKILKYLNDLQSWNFSVLWLSEPKQWKWSKTRHFLMGHIQIWHLFYQNVLKYFNWHLKSKFPSFITKVNSNNGNEQNQIFFQGAYLNLTLFSLVVKY